MSDNCNSAVILSALLYGNNLWHKFLPTSCPTFLETSSNLLKHAKTVYWTILIVFVLLGPVSANYEIINSKRCTHFTLDEGQQGNAFFYEGRECCLCGLGTKFSHVCNVDDPLSTGCDFCGKDEYRDFEPHLQRDCEQQVKKYCRDPKVLLEGSIYHPTRCVCKPGFEEINTMCVPLLVTIAPPSSTGSIITDKKITQNLFSTKFTTVTVPNELETSSPKTTVGKTTVGLVTEHNDPVTTSISTGLPHNSNTGYTDKDDHSPTEPVPPYLVALIVIGVLIIIIIVSFWVYCMVHRGKDQSRKTDIESPVDSFQKLIGRNNREEDFATRVGEVNETNGGDSETRIFQSPVADMGKDDGKEKSSTGDSNIEIIDAQKNMAVPIGSENENADRVRREQPSGVLTENPNQHVDPRLPNRHKDKRTEAISKVISIINRVDLNMLGHWMMSHIDFDDIKRMHERDGSMELATQLFRRGLELKPNLTLYNFHDKVKAMGLGYLENVFEDHINVLEREEVQQPE